MPQYGFSSSTTPSNLNNYLKYIYNIGIRHIDTAPSYGHSENTIGQYHKNMIENLIYGLRLMD